MNNKIEGVIFDFNGTLFFDSEMHKKAWNRISMEIRSKPISNDEFLKFVFGYTNSAILQFLFREETSDNLIEDYAIRKEEYYRTMCLQDQLNLKLVKGATELFDFLNKQNVKITIATASEIVNVKFFNAQFELERWFDFKKIVYDDNKIKGKPAPDMYLQAAKNIGVQASKCIVFEDSETGIAAAKNAGIGKIIVLDPKAEKSKFNAHPDVDMVIRDYSVINMNQYL